MKKRSVEFWAWFDGIRGKLGSREATFDRMFEYLDTQPEPITIVETGCTRRDPTKDESWAGDGCSTLIFDKYVQGRGGHVYSVDIDPEATAACRKLVSDYVTVWTGDSVKRLRDLAEMHRCPDLLYLDSLDRMQAQPFETSLHCANEFFAMLPVITEDTLVVCDDTPPVLAQSTDVFLEITGKGAFVAKHAEAVGAKNLFSAWQIGWTHMAKLKNREVIPGPSFDAEVREMIERARAHVEAGETSDAHQLYRAVMQCTSAPKTPVQRVARGEAYAFNARLAASIGRYGTAADWYREAIMIDPRAVDYRIELILKCHRPMANWQLARQEALRCTLLEPDNPQVWRVLGDIELSLCDEERCTAAYEEALRLAPDDASVMLDRCVIALDMSDFATCHELVGKIIHTERKADAVHVMAMIANREGRHEDAIALYDQAIAAGCHNIETAHWNKSLSLHALGRYREGWIEHEHRKNEPHNPALSIAFQRFTPPLLLPDTPPTMPDGRKAILLIHAEAGMGDNIAFTRFLKHFIIKGFQVRYECHKEMVGLMRRSFPDVEVVERAPDYPGAIGIKPFDYHLPLGSMTYVLGTDIDTVPSYKRYLCADRAKALAYSNCFLHERRTKIGLCWSSGIREYGIWIKHYGQRKSMRFEQLMPLFKPGCSDEEMFELVSLQVGPERAENNGAYCEDLLPQVPDWDDTAALVANLDLVITVDTAVAHLAGALGVPCWVLMQQDGASWHFMSERPGSPWNERSPWYPSVRIFRQRTPGDWGDVVSRVAEELARVVHDRFDG